MTLAEDEGGARMEIRIGRDSLVNGPGKDFCGSGAGGRTADGFGESCSLLGDTSRSRERS